MCVICVKSDWNLLLLEPDVEGFSLVLPEAAAALEVEGVQEEEVEGVGSPPSRLALDGPAHVCHKEIVNKVTTNCTLTLAFTAEECTLKPLLESSQEDRALAQGHFDTGSISPVALQ